MQALKDLLQKHDCAIIMAVPVHFIIGTCLQAQEDAGRSVERVGPISELQPGLQGEVVEQHGIQPDDDGPYDSEHLHWQCRIYAIAYKFETDQAGLPQPFQCSCAKIQLSMHDSFLSRLMNTLRCEDSSAQGLKDHSAQTCTNGGELQR